MAVEDAILEMVTWIFWLLVLIAVLSFVMIALVTYGMTIAHKSYHTMMPYYTTNMPYNSPYSNRQQMQHQQTDIGYSYNQ